MEPIQITMFRWAGKWGPFEVKIPCGECTVTVDILRDVIDKELAGVPIELDVREWLSEWWKPLRRGAWHAPIVMVEGKVVAEGEAVNRGVLCQAITEAYVKRSQVEGNVVFGKQTCPHCQRAKQMLDETSTQYQYHDVVENPRALYEMFARVKPIVGPKTPITVPQIWLGGSYIGGADQLAEHFSKS